MQTPPGPRSYLPGRFLRAMQRDPIPFFTKLARDFGEGLLTSEGAFHLRQRRLAQPAFHRDRIARYGAVMINRAARIRETWRDGEMLEKRIQNAKFKMQN
jgi:cytochrome P450